MGCRLLLLIPALAFLITYVALAIRGLPYPYELEWMEGGMVDHVIRVLEGGSLYVAPTVDFVPFLYTPFY
jgi:hypothetical protein